NFVNYDQDDWYQLLPLAEHAYNHSTMNSHKMSPFYTNYGFHPQTEWMKERKARNPGTEVSVHWMKTIHRKAQETLEQTKLAMAKYYDRKALEQPDIKLGDKVILHAKNVHSKRP